jgi:AbrB family looped-hinge helix DNA binding protein
VYESTVTAKGQTTLPKDVRELLGLEPGDRIRYLVTGDTVRILRPRKAMSLCGALKRDGPPVSLEAMDAAIRNRACGGGDR